MRSPEAAADNRNRAAAMADTRRHPFLLDPSRIFSFNFPQITIILTGYQGTSKVFARDSRKWTSHKNRFPLKPVTW
jgi:hypothetical protein